MKNGLQKFGKFLSAMVMPNIGAFIAWGFITALFIADGWIPNAKLASIQPYMLTFLLPMLIAYTGGKQVGGDRGGVMGAIAVMGCIAGVGGFDGQPMLMGAMVMGPFAGWVIKKFDKAMDGHMPAGFEMLINNFSVGILGMIVAIIGYFIIGPFMSAVLAVLTAGVNVLVKAKLIPLAAIFIEPAKVLFLNNAINHGIFTPIGIEQAKEAGKSIMYMLEANPGPGLGVLLAYAVFSKDKVTKSSAPQAQLVIINNFLQDPNLDGLYEQMTAKVDASAQTAAAVEEVETPVATGNTKILVEEGIKTGLKPVDKFEAIKAAGKLLNELGYVEEGYIDAMVKREETVTTYMGLGVAIPHGTGDAKKKVQKTGIVMLQYPEGVDFDGEKAQLVFGIAGIGDEHLGLLAKISEIIEDPERLEQLKTTKNVDEIMEMFK